MPGLSLHIATGGHHVPPGNAGSNPLAAGSEHHLGPSLGIFSGVASPQYGALDLDLLFVAGNALGTSFHSGALSVVSMPSEIATPYDTRIRVEGVSYKIPESIAKMIRGKNGGRVYWRAGTGSGTIDEGSFRFYRNAPPVFR